MNGDELVRLRDVRTYFHDKGGLAARLAREEQGAVRAVDGVDLDIGRGQIVGLVGESGSGKTTLGRTILGLERATDGEVAFDGHDMRRVRGGELRRLRRRMQMVFQDPHASLSPRMRVASLVTEPYRMHGVPPESRRSPTELLEMVEVSSEQLTKYPHELSGGQARRIGIARALALQPEFLVADEPTSGLDVSAAAAILNLLRGLAGELGLTYLIITHDLDVVGYFADTIAVMYLGKLVEIGPVDAIFDAPAHPYTRALIASVAEPDPGRRRERKLLLPGEIPSPRDPPPGCRFHTRCPYARERCRVEEPPLERVEEGHVSACHFWPEVRADALAATREGR